MNYDPEFARGTREPDPVPTLETWKLVQNVRRATLELEKVLSTVVPDSAERESILRDLDRIGCYAECVVLRYRRNGQPIGNTDLKDMEGLLRLTKKNPEMFKTLDLDDLKKKVEALRRAPKL